MVGDGSGGWEKFHMVGEDIILVNMFSNNILKRNKFSLKFLLVR
jgi:hypothetical protein